MQTAACLHVGAIVRVGRPAILRLGLVCTAPAAACFTVVAVSSRVPLAGLRCCYAGAAFSPVVVSANAGE